MTFFIDGGFVEFQFRKNDNGAVSWTEWNIVMKFCIHIDIDKCIPWDCQMTFEIGWVFAEVQLLKKWHLSSVEALPSAKFWKSENGLISWTEGNILIDFCVNIDIDKI